jgi:hypothetical protein
MANARLNAVPHEFVLLGLIPQKGFNTLRKASGERGPTNITCCQNVMCTKCPKCLASMHSLTPLSKEAAAPGGALRGILLNKVCAGAIPRSSNISPPRGLFTPTWDAAGYVLAAQSEGQFGPWPPRNLARVDETLFVSKV